MSAERSEAAETPLARQHGLGRLGARERLEVLFDGAFEPSGEGVITARGEIGGRPVHAIAQDVSVTGGQGTDAARRVCAALAAAEAEGAPVVTLYDTRGLRLADGLAGLAGQGDLLAAQAALSVPQVAVVMGPCAGAAGIAAAGADFRIMVRGSHLVLTGAEVVAAVTQEVWEDTALGGTDLHGTRSGLADRIAQTDLEALFEARRLVDHLPGAPRRGAGEAAEHETPALETLIPDAADAPYDMAELAAALADAGEVIEIGAGWAAHLMTALVRIDGRPVGLLASQPLHADGVLDAAALDKATRFVRRCGRLGLPLLRLVDAPGFLPGPETEAAGVAGHGAALVRAWARARGSGITLVTRRAYGGVHGILASGGGPVLAWPTARIGPMGARGAVERLHPELGGDEAALAERMRAYTEAHLHPERAVAAGLVDEIVAPSQSRRRICALLAARS